MSHKLNLDAVDVDGAVRETAAEAMDALDGDTRSQFLRRAGLAGGALAGGGALIAALAPNAMAYTTGDRPPATIFGRGDLAILNYALVLEYLESDFYNGAYRHQQQTGFLNNNPQAKAFLGAVYKDEAAHVSLLRTALGKAQIHSPKFDFHGKNMNERDFIATSSVLEETGVHAYLGQAFNIAKPQYLNVAATIVTVEARHAGVIGLIKSGTSESIAPFGPRDQPRGASKVIKAVESTHFITKLYKAPGA